MQSSYETDDIEQAKSLLGKYKDVTVIYHNKDAQIPLIVTKVINGKLYTQYNPEYIKYLKEKYPDLSDKEINHLIGLMLNNQETLINEETSGIKR